MKKKRHFVPVGNTNRDKRVRQPRTKGPLLSRLPDPGQKGTPFCPGLSFPVGKPGQQRFPNRDKSTFLQQCVPDFITRELWIYIVFYPLFCFHLTAFGCQKAIYSLCPFLSVLVGVRVTSLTRFIEKMCNICISK